jgi:PAS domain S-box-containing protein
VRTRPGSYVLQVAIVSAVYFGGAKLGLSLAVGHGVITPVWPPTGIAIAALLLLGPRVWPAVAIGALLGNATSGVSFWVATGIAVGNTLEALVAVYLLRRFSFRKSFERVQDVVRFACAAAIAAGVAATNGVTVLALADSAAASPYGSRWLLWWLGDATGALLVAPLILVWATRPPLRIPRRRLAEGAAVLAALAGLAALIFLGGLWRYPYLIFPLLLWAAVRFTQLGAVTASVTVAAFGVAGVISANVPLGGRDETVAVEILQSLLAVTAISLLALGASISERDSAAESLRQAAVGLAEAQALAHIGSWEWDIAGDRVTWSNELYRIYDLQPERGELNYEAYLSRIHPGDRDRVRSTIAVALDEGHAFELTHRAVLGDGSERIVQGRGRVILDRAGHPLRMVGTSQDITERERVEQVRENILSAVSHELRTPLTAILGFAITLRERWPTLSHEGREEMIGLVASQATRLERLLNDLLDVDRLRHGRLRVDFEHADLAELVRTVVAGRPDGREIDVQAQSVHASVDPAKFERIVENLIANAERHTPAGSPIEVSVAPDGTGVLLRVDDHGPGVPDAEKETIFQAFTRGSEVEVTGIGVGLSLVAQFAALHGGRAWVEDNPGGGASFRVLFPGIAA